MKATYNIPIHFSLRKVNTFLFVFFFLFHARSQTVSTIAGVQDNIGSINDISMLSTFNNPHGVEIDKHGVIYIADRYNHLIRKIDTLGNVTTLAGSGLAGSADGQGTAASFKEPWGLTVDNEGNVFVADTKNNKIRKISPSGLVTTIAGTGTFGVKDAVNPLSATFGNPVGIAIDKEGNLYIGDHLTNIIRKISVLGEVTTFAGDKNYPTNYGLVDGKGQAAKFYRPYGVEVDRLGNVYVADEWNHAVRKISPEGEVVTIGGNGTKGNLNGPKSVSLYNYPWDVAIDSIGNVFIADGYNYVIRKIDTSSVSSVFAGVVGKYGANDGNALTATFNGATSLSMDKKFKFIIVGDAYNQLIRKITFPIILGSLSKPVISFASTVKDSMTICEGTDVTISIAGSFDTYEVYNNGVKIATTSTNKFVLSSFYLQNGLHTIEVKGLKNGYSNQTSNVLKINSLNNTTFTIVKDFTIPLCEGDTARLVTSDSSIVTWNTGEVSSSILSITSGKYYVSSIQGECLSPQDTILLEFNKVPNPSIQLSINSTLYEGDTLILRAADNLNYLWNTNEMDQTIRVTQSGSYLVSVTNSSGCTSISDTLFVSFVSIPDNLQIFADQGIKFCQGDSIPLRASFYKNISWFRNGELLNFTDSVIYIKSSGDYSFQCKIDDTKFVFSDTLRCVSNQLPDADFFFSMIKETNSYYITQFNASSYSTGNTYFWKVDTTSLTSTINPTYTFTEEGEHIVYLEVTNLSNCKAFLSKPISVVFESQFFIPTAFTPNKDGNNDFFKVLGVLPNTPLQMLVFNEWGNLVFSSDSSVEFWDGTFKGEDASAGNYSYLLQIELEGKQQTIKGIVTLIR